MGNDEEKFTRIQIDNKIDTGWQKPVPHINYWSFMLSRRMMSQEQSEFFKYMSEMLDKGVAVELHGQFGYVSLLKDQLIRQFHSPVTKDKAAIIEKAKKLVRLYNYKGNDLNPVLAMEILQSRKARLGGAKKEDLAQWIAPGQEVEVAGRTLIRGGFYLGSHLAVATFNPDQGKFNVMVDDVEGPVINPKYVDTDSEFHVPQPSTFAEQSPALRRDIIDWLAGERQITSEILAYHIAGLEFFLLFDKRPPLDQRLDAIFYLESLLRNPDIPYGMMTSYRQRIQDLIDLALSRYFIDIIDQILVEYNPEIYPRVTRAKYCRWIHENIDLKDSSAAKAEKLAAILHLPKGLTADYAEDFKKEFKRQLVMECNSRYTPWCDDSQYQYLSMNMQGVYFPPDAIRNSLKKAELQVSPPTMNLFLQFKQTWSRMLSSAKSFLLLLEVGASPLALQSKLPSWIKPDKIPGVKEALAQIAPEPDAGYKMVPVTELMQAFGIPTLGPDYLDKADFLHLQVRLYNLGLRIGATNTVIRIRIDDKVPVVRYESSDIPRRGTLPVALFLICCLLSADGATKRDLEMVDQWLEQYDTKADWTATAQGIVRWLAPRKLTLNAKRKAKAAKLATLPKRRAELQRLLLQLVSDPEGASAKRMKRLQAIYESIGLDPATIHSDIHRLATGASKPGKRAASAQGKKASAVLDRALLRQMEQSTASAKEMLAQVFQDPSESKESQPAEAKKAKRQDPLAEIVAALAQQESWTRADFDALAKKHGQTPGAALEKVNDKAYDLLDEPIVEDDGDTITVDTALAQSLIKALQN